MSENENADTGNAAAVSTLEIPTLCFLIVQRALYSKIYSEPTLHRKPHKRLKKAFGASFFECCDFLIRKGGLDDQKKLKQKTLGIKIEGCLLLYFRCGNFCSNQH
jgi:hypothetical protein